MNQTDLERNAKLLGGSLQKKGYCRFWHLFSGQESTTGLSRTFFIECYLLNPSLGQDQPILGQHPYFKRRGRKPSYVCVKVGAFPDENGEGGKQLHAFYPISSLKATASPLVLQVEDCFFSETKLSGFVDVTDEEAVHPFFMSDAGSFEWDLEVHKAVACHTGFLSSIFSQALNLLDSYWHGEGIKSFFRGRVILDGVSYDIEPDTSYGYCDKHWGKNFNSPWLQLSSGCLFSEHTGKELKHSVFAMNGCCPRFGFIPLKRKMLIQLTYTGEDFNFGFRPFILSRCKWETKVTNKRYIWHVTAKNKDAIIKISGACTKEQLMDLKYEDPNGQLSKYALLTGAGGIGTIKLYRRTSSGKKLIDTLHMEKMYCEYRRK